MKAFVIKNKEGKYFCGFDYFPDINIFSENIIDGIKASTYEYCQKEIEDFDLKDCKVVEITIEEVDKNLTPTNYDNLSIEDKLKYKENQVRIARDRDVEYNDKITELEFTIKRKEEQLAEKDKEIAHLENCNKSLSNKFDKESDMQNKIDILKYNVEGLEEQLRDKTKEIEELKTFNAKNMYDTICHALNMQEKQIRKQVCDEVKDVIVCHSEWNEQGYIISMVMEDLLKEIDIIKQPKENK